MFVIDGSFQITALGGFPKTFVKYAEKYIGASGILKLLQGELDRTFEWTNVLYYKDKKTEKAFTGYIKGEIISKIPEGKKGNSFDLIQRPNGYDMTFSEMDANTLHYFEEHVWQPILFKEFTNWYLSSKH